MKNFKGDFMIKYKTIENTYLFDNIINMNTEKEEYIDNYLKEIKKFPYIYLWGISESCDEAINFFTGNDIFIKAIFELNPDKYSYKYKNIDVIEQIFDDIDPLGAIVITCSYYETIKNKLLIKNKDIENRLFLFDGYFLENRDINYFLENKNVIEKCYNALEDNKSKEIYNALLKYRYIRNPKLIEDLYESRNECYLDKVFIDNYKPGLYIDAGSYNADFIITLANKVSINNSSFYIFEPNKIFYNNIINNLDTKINYKIFNVALCDKDTTMEFIQIPSSTSHIIDKKYNAYKNIVDRSNIDIIKTNKLDTIITDEKVTGIKIDIEGSEASMLKGAVNIIKRDRPILLLSIYHKWNDLFKLQDYLMSLNLNYKFYIRHYSLSVAKTILYCIPNKIQYK